MQTVPEQSIRTSVQVIKQKVTGDCISDPELDYLAIEDPLQLTLEYQRESQRVSKPLFVTMRTPGLDRELIYGILFTSGIIQKHSDIIEIQFEQTSSHAAPTQACIQLNKGLDASAASVERNIAMHSSCGACGTVQIGQLSIPKSLRIENHFTVSAQIIHALPDHMQGGQETFQTTGGLHAAALCDTDGTPAIICEDIGRHNALDKVIGVRLLDENTSRTNSILCVSGRMSYDILQKAIIARIPIIAGIGAPSSMAVALANDFNITLIGFLRGDSFSIYSAPKRVEHTQTS